jgi:hypothetical protein
MCGVIARTLKKKTRKETNLTFSKLWQFQYFYMTAKQTLRKRLEQNSSGRDEIFENS